jgi:fosfomycin resistance protein FosX
VIQGLSYLTFIVHDPDKMARITVDVLGGREVYASGDMLHSNLPEKLGFYMRSSRPRVEGEGQSLYFHDYDNH